MNLVFVIAMNAALACGDAKASVEFDVPASVLTVNDGTELLRELSGVLLKDGKITLDAKNGLIRGRQQAFGDYRVSLNMDRRQLALSCGEANATTEVTTKRHARGRRFASSSAQTSRCEREVSAMIQTHLTASR